MKGSLNFEARIGQGYVIGEPRYAGYEPHHQRAEGGAWIYVNIFNPIDEVALRWISEGKPVLVPGEHIVAETDDDIMSYEGPYIVRRTRGRVVEAVLELTEDQVDVWSEWYQVSEDEWEAEAEIYGTGDPSEYTIEFAGCRFRTQRDVHQFAKEVQELRAESNPLAEDTP